MLRLYERVGVAFDWSTCTFVDKCTEGERYFIDKKTIKRFCLVDGEWVMDSANLNLSETAQYRYRQLVQDLSVIREVISKSPACYSGFADVVAEYANRGLRTRDLLTYIRRWQKTPQIEVLWKNGLTKLAIEWNDRHHGYLVKNKFAESLAEYFGLTEGQFATVQACNPDAGELYTWQTVFEVFPDMTVQELNSVRDILANCYIGDGRNPDGFFSFCVQGLVCGCIGRLRERGVNISLTDAAQYIWSCYTTQCIEAPDAVMAWGKYLSVASQLYDISKEEARCPNSLRLMTDIAEFLVRKNKLAEKQNQKQ